MRASRIFALGEDADPIASREALRDRGDPRLAELKPCRVRSPAGNVYDWPTTQPIPDGYTVVDPTGIDKELGARADSGKPYTQRDLIHRDLERDAYELHVTPYRTGRIAYDGGEVIRELADDRDVLTSGAIRAAFGFNTKGNSNG